MLADLGGQVRVGAEHGRYLITGCLGYGTSAVVFRAVHQMLGVPVALKFVRASARDRNPKSIEEFRRESQLLARLSHPNVVRVWDFDDSPKLPCIALEFVDGLNLADLLKQAGKLRPDKALNILEESVKGLGAAWELGIVHRDVKPGNILVGRRGEVKVADLGLAAVVDDPALVRELGGGDLKAKLVGTAAYLPPEQAKRPTAADHRSDIYALGATFYQVLTDRLPFAGRSARETILMHLSEPLTPPHVIDPDVPEDLSLLVAKMLAKKPRDRYQSGDEILADIERVRTRTQEESAATPPPAPWTSEAPVFGPDNPGENPQERVARAVRASFRGQSAQSLIELRAVVKEHPDCEDGWLWLARLSEDPEESGDCIRKLIRINPRHAEAWRLFELTGWD